jgi:lipopolysaccharide transport system permease protein
VFGEVVSLLTRHRELTWVLAKRDLSERYAGQWLRTFWVVAHPLLVMGVYVLVFTLVFGARLVGAETFPQGYAAYILAGLIPWMAFQESMHKSCQAVTGNAALVQQVVFPVEVLPVKGVLASLVTQVIGIGGLTVFGLVWQGRLPLTYGMLPLLFALQLLAMIGTSYILSSVSVYFRDLKDLIQVFCVIGVYLMPVLYLPDWVPASLQSLLYLNPFSYMAWCYQDALYFGRFDHPWAWLVFSALSLGVFYVGCSTFRHLKTWFGSAL